MVRRFCGKPVQIMVLFVEGDEHEQMCVRDVNEKYKIIKKDLPLDRLELARRGQNFFSVHCLPDWTTKAGGNRVFFFL